MIASLHEGQETENLLSAIAEIAKLRMMLLDLVDEPVNQDEQGGCHWCGGPFGKDSGMYATENPADHAGDCPWSVGRQYLKTFNPTK